MPTTLSASFNTANKRLDQYAPETGTLTIVEPNNNLTVKGWYRIESNQLVVQPENGWFYTALHNAGSVDIETSFSIVSTHAASISAGMGYVKDRDNYITANASSGSWRRYKRIAGAMTSAAFATPTAHDPSDVLTVERDGNDLLFFVDDVLVDTYTLTSGEQTVFDAVTTVGMTSRDASVNTTFENWSAGTTSVAPTLTVDDPDKVYVVDPDATTTDITFEGTCAGAVGGELEYQIFRETTAGSGSFTTLVRDWTDALDLDMEGGTYSFRAAAVSRQTSMMKVRTRDKATPSTVSPLSAIFGVGYSLMLVGQSWVADLYANAMSLATFGITQDANRAYTQRAGAFSNGATQLQVVAEMLVELSGGFPWSVSARGIGATSLSALNPGTANWTNVGIDITGTRGKLTGFHLEHGHADITLTAAAYNAEQDDCLDNTAATPPGLLALLGVDGSQLAITVSTLGRKNGAASTADTGYSKIRAAQHDWVGDRVALGDNAHVSHSNIDLTHTDADHTLPSSNTGTVEYLRRIGRAQAVAHGFATHSARGPRLDIATAIRNGTNAMIVPALNGSTALTGTGPFTAWQETTDGSTWVDVADLTRSGEALVCADRGQVGFRHLYGDNPDISNLARGDVKAHSSSSVNLPVEPTYSTLAVTEIDPASGASSATTEDATAAGTGAVADVPPATGASTAVLEDVTATGEGAVTAPPSITGSSEATTGDVEAAGEGTVVNPGSVIGASTATLEDVTASGAGTVETVEASQGGSDATTEDVTASGTGDVADAGEIALFDVDVPASRIFESLDT